MDLLGKKVNGIHPKFSDHSGQTGFKTTGDEAGHDELAGPDSPGP